MLKIKNEWLICECGRKIQKVYQRCEASNLLVYCSHCKQIFLINVKNGKIISHKVLTK